MDPLDMLTRRRTMFDYVPVHKLFMSDTRRTESSEELIEILGHSYYHYFLKGKLSHYSITPIERDNHTLAIYRFDEMHEQYENACKDRRVLMYREHFALRMPNDKGEVTYKLSLYDLYNMACICVTLTVNAKQRGKAYLEFREEMDFSGGTEDLMDFDSDMMYKNEPLKTRTDPPPLKKGEKETPKHLRPTWIQMLKPKMVNMRVQKGRVLTNVLYIKFHFDAAATLDFRLFAMPGRPNEPTTLRPEDTEPETTTEWTTESSTLTGDWSTTTGTPSTTTNISGRRVSEDFWGMHPNRLFKEELAEITADVLDTVAVGSRSSLAKAVLALQCFLSVVFLRADLFIN
ncbi:uncharacterized protein LOC124639074 [Helicoverpa zea]|uniref:uncharacterized protein LOC124639074 n=1 Tax=Helicoverpa zea TaxID=7113 RepID=UPI001F564A2F|nr:uncharacterized protein LOC124639074 [Helicoverpa zea]